MESRPTEVARNKRKEDLMETTRLTIGADACCTDGVCGVISRVVLDPVERVVTHLAVEPKHRLGLGRLVPLDRVDVSRGGVRVDCTMAEFENLDHAEEMELLPASGGHADYTAGEALPQPYFGLRDILGEVPQPITYDTIPSGEVEVRRGEPVHATDGAIGRIKGLVFDSGRHRVTDVLVEEGHLWSRMEIAVPISAVATIRNGIWLNIAKDEVRRLPPFLPQGRETI